MHGFPKLNLYKSKLFRGFTLIELLIAIAIIGITASSIAYVTNNSQKSARDAVRKNNLKTIAGALERYKVDFGKYPPPDATPNFSYNSKTGVNWIPELVPDYIKTIPKDPKQAGFFSMFAFRNIFSPKNAIAAGTTFIKTAGTSCSEEPDDAIYTSDGGYLISARFISCPANSGKMLLLKYDSSGNLSWSKTLGTTGETYSGLALAQATDGYIITGQHLGGGTPNGGAYLMKVSSAGDLVWSKYIYSGNEFLTPYAIAATGDGYVITGWYSANLSPNARLPIFKFDLNGNLIFKKIYPLPGTGDAYGYDLKVTSDGFIVAGQKTQAPMLAKFDSSGALSWSKIYSSGLFYSVVQVPDGYFAGGIGATGGAYFAKLSPTGEIIWQRDIFGNGEQIKSVLKDTDGNLIATGRTSAGVNTDMLLIKINSGDGSVVWPKTIGTAGRDRGYILVQAADGGFGVVGRSESATTSWDIILAKTDANGDIASCSGVASYTPTNNNATASPLSLSAVESDPVQSVFDSSPPPGSTPITVVETDPCGATASPDPTPTVQPTPTTNPSPSSSPGPDDSIYFGFYPSDDRRSFILWAQLERTDDPAINTKPGAKCTAATPVNTNFNYCVQGN